jgi:hypothetical protein
LNGRGAQNWIEKRVLKIPGFGLELTAPRALKKTSWVVRQASETPENTEEEQENKRLL